MCSFGKCFHTNFRTVFPTFVLTFFEKGGLNHITFRFLFFIFFFSSFSNSVNRTLGVYVGSVMYQLFLNAFLYGVIEVSYITLVEHNSDILLLIEIGSCFNIGGG